jgi:hypothetical protein
MVNVLGDVTVAVRARVVRIDGWAVAGDAVRLMARLLLADAVLTTAAEVAAMPTDLMLAYLDAAETRAVTR